MAINGEHATIILKRVFECRDPSEQIVLISGKDNRRFAIHRVILNAASKYFSDVLGPNFDGEKPKESVLDSDGETIESAVDFFYTGNINLTADNVGKFLAIASYAEIDLLGNKCHQYFSENLSVDSSVSILMMADEYRFGDVRARAFKLTCDQFEKVPSTELQKLSQPLLQELLECDKIQERGDLCSERLLEWFKCDEDKRGVFMPNLLKLIRLELLSVEFLSDTLEAVFLRFKCSNLVNLEYKRRAIGQRSNSTVQTSISSLCPSSVENSQPVPGVPALVFVHHDSSYNFENSKIVIEKYNKTSKSFERVNSLVLRPWRLASGFVLHKNKVFVLGGYGANLELMKSVFSYDITSGKKEVLPEMAVARARFTTTLLGKYIYVFGGEGESSVLASCERFDTENNSWKTIRSMNVARSYAAVTTFNGCIYMAGGSISCDSDNSVELYNPRTDEWVEQAPSQVPCKLLIESNGFLFSIGRGQKNIERFKPYKNSWEMFESFETSHQIISSMKIDRELFAIMQKGEFGRIEIDGDGNSAFVALSKYSFEFGYFPPLFLYEYHD